MSQGVKDMTKGGKTNKIQVQCVYNFIHTLYIQINYISRINRNFINKMLSNDCVNSTGNTLYRVISSHLVNFNFWWGEFQSYFLPEFCLLYVLAHIAHLPHGLLIMRVHSTGFHLSTNELH